MYTTPKRISHPCYSNQSPNDSFSEYSQSVPKIIWDNKSRSPFNLKYNEKHQKNSDEDIAEISKVFDKHQDNEFSQSVNINPFITKESHNLSYNKKIHQEKRFKLLKLKEQAKLLLKQKDQSNDHCKNHNETITPNLWDDISVNEEDFNFLSDAEVMLTQITDNLYDKQRCKFNTPPHKTSTNKKTQNSDLSLNQHNPLISNNPIIPMAPSPQFNSTHSHSSHKLNPLNKTRDLSINVASQSPIIPLFVKPKKLDNDVGRKPLSMIDQNRKRAKNFMQLNNNLTIFKPEPLNTTEKNSIDKTLQSTFVQKASMNLPEKSKLDTVNSKNKCSEIFDDYISEDIILALTQDDDDFF